MAYGGHFGPKNPEMDKYCQENGYGKSDCDYNTLLNNVLKKSSVITEEKEIVKYLTYDDMCKILKASFNQGPEAMKKATGVPANARLKGWKKDEKPDANGRYGQTFIFCIKEDKEDVFNY